MAWPCRNHAGSAKLRGRGTPLDAAEGVPPPSLLAPAPRCREEGRGTVLLTETHSSLKGTF